MPISDKEYIADLGECMTKLEADLAALREENARLKADLKRLEGLLLSVARVIRGRDGLPCWCDDYDARPDHTHSAKCIEARRIRAQREEEPEVWRCEGCGETFDRPTRSHGRADHAPGCDGSCRSCPVEVECGPISALRTSWSERSR